MLAGVPRVLRADLGTENTFLAWIQPVLRHQHNDLLSDAQACFRYGRSVFNQVYHDNLACHPCPIYMNHIM